MKLHLDSCHPGFNCGYQRKAHTGEAKGLTKFFVRSQVARQSVEEA